jgi:hypothetical protein
LGRTGIEKAAGHTGRKKRLEFSTKPKLKPEREAPPVSQWVADYFKEANGIESATEHGDTHRAPRRR